MIERTQVQKDIIRQVLFKGAIELACSPRSPEMTTPQMIKWIKEVEEELFNIKGETGVKINL